VLGWKRTVVALASTTLLSGVTTVVPAAVQAPTAAAAAATATAMPSRYERRVVYWTNVVRERRGIRPVRLRACPDRYAERWARHLARTGRFYHQDVTRMFDCPRVNRVGENLIRGRVSPKRAVRMWKRSEPHRRNLLNRRYTHIGVGSFRSDEDGRIYTSQTFTGPR
jgi:uncharacterized protein YkwD